MTLLGQPSRNIRSATRYHAAMNSLRARPLALLVLTSTAACSSSVPSQSGGDAGDASSANDAPGSVVDAPGSVADAPGSVADADPSTPMGFCLALSALVASQFS